MVCIAAFIIILIEGFFVAFISIFKPKVGKRYLKTLKKSWGCFGKRVTLQKCETGFGDDVKNSLLSRLLLKNPKLVKPAGKIIEVASILLVVITIWSLVEGAKAGLALWTLGTCNVKHASACSLGAEVCSIDDNSEPQNVIDYVGLWFSDWGEIFSAMPDKFRDWNVDNFDFNGIGVSVESSENERPKAIDIFDPGCEVCLQSYTAQKEAGFFDKYDVTLVPFPIHDNDGKYKFTNSLLVVKYIFAVDAQGEPKSGSNSEMKTSLHIIDRIFTEKDDQYRIYQGVFNDVYSAEEAEQTLKDWLKEFGYSSDEIAEISTRANESAEINDKIEKNNNIVTNNIHAKGIPTMIYDGGKHTGRWEE